MSLRLALICSFAGLLAGCANQQEPPGGPIDLVPPEIVATFPASNDVNVQTDRITIEFSEYVEQRSVEESIFISPSVGGVEYEWSGKSVDLILAEPLRPMTTYVVNIGTDVLDRRNRNRLAQSHVLAFSTGPNIDRGAISGSIIPRTPADALSGVMIFAYPLAGRDPDTLDPRTTQPDYITQTGKDGSFLLQHVALGAYRVIAVRDEFRNLLYDPEADDFGVPSIPIELTEADTLCAGVTMRLSREDTTAPRLIRADAIDKNHIGIQFSESILRQTLLPDSIDIRDTTDGRPLSVFDVMMFLPGATSFVLRTGEMDSSTTYRLIVRGATDSVGLRMTPPTNSLRFAGSGQVDTIPAAIRSISLKDSMRSLSTLPVITVQFNDAVSQSNHRSFISLTEEKGLPVSISVEWIDPASIVINTLQPLRSKQWYTLHLMPDSLSDWSGNPLKDSTRQISFETVDEEDFGSIEGQIEDMRPMKSKGNYFIQYGSLEKKNAGIATAQADRTGVFRILNLSGGKYSLRVFVDENGNGEHDAGLPFPFMPSERIQGSPDTLKVRPRWPLDGVILRFR